MNRSCLISLRIPLDLLDRLENAVKEQKFPSVSEAIRTNVEVGLYIESCKGLIKDQKFLKSIEELKQTEGIFDWLQTLTDSQLDAMHTASKMEKEKRYDTRTLR